MSEYYDLATLLAYPGAVVAITLLCGAVSYLGGSPVQPFLKWVALVGALLLAAVGALAADPVGWLPWVVAFFNAIVLFLAAVGGNAVLASTAAPARGAELEAAMDGAEADRRGFRVRWL